ncbi:MAG: bifunctional demethylmenaquinone methyltransferase/2-methoxy-6-polyprenyl-1,4-benzoquinol methylase UbiE [Acidiferrobacteraceae bacterium]
MSDKPTADFGFREVPEERKAGLVRGVFDSVAGRYDLMNDAMSLGLHRLWKRFAVSQCPVRPGDRVLDLAGGTGDVATLLWRAMDGKGEIVLADINHAMIETGRERLADRGLFRGIRFVQADAENLPFGECTFDCVTIAFGLRNVTRKQRALEAMFRVLKPGGALLVLDFSKPHLGPLNAVYDRYSFSWLPRLGRWLAQDAGSYRYLAESIRRHPDQETLTVMMERAGFGRVRHFNLSGGIVALHRGYRL